MSEQRTFLQNGLEFEASEVGVILRADELAKLDAWISMQDVRIDRSEAIRRIVNYAMQVVQ